MALGCSFSLVVVVSSGWAPGTIIVMPTGRRRMRRRAFSPLRRGGLANSSSGDRAGCWSGRSRHSAGAGRNHARRHVLLAHDQHVRESSPAGRGGSWRPACRRQRRPRRAGPSARSARGHLVGVGLGLLADRQHPGLHRRQPQRERARVVLDQHGDEALHRPEQRAVDHDRPLAAAVRGRRTRARSARAAGSRAGWSSTATRGRGRP